MSELKRSFQYKYLWAHQHLEALQKELVSFHSQNPCVVVHDFNRKTLKHTWRVHGHPKLPQPRISLLIGDLLYNWRAVLDHLAWDIMLAATGRTPHVKTAFPIFEKSADFEGMFKPGRPLERMPARIRTELEKLQPYPGTKPNSTNARLHLLNRLGNIEKHRHFNLIVASVDLSAFSIGHDLLDDYFLHRGPVEHGTVVASATTEMDVEFNAAYGVAFGEGGEGAGELVHELMIRIELAIQEVLTRIAWFPLTKIK